LKDENGDYYPLNMLIHVLTHEIAHFLNTKDVGHTPEFYKVFDEILKNAAEQGIYNPSIPLVKNYCNSD
jgi:predicted metal-dependent hydrolase